LAKAQKSNGRAGRARVDAYRGKPYLTYRFIDKDPVIDVLRTAQQDANIKPGKIATASGVSPSTIHGWFYGKTRKPQFATVVAVARSIGAIDRIEALIRRGR
jgi:hypothetical protein